MLSRGDGQDSGRTVQCNGSDIMHEPNMFNKLIYKGIQYVCKYVYTTGEATSPNLAENNEV